ncbi:MAG: serine dehydratase subunit alpha family protein, partial [Christensenellaceae bacterium]|nr:serine dehydratase subunit alpha family protein [Christensenellaceae bacterium]
DFLNNTPISLDVLKEDTLLCIKIMLKNGENTSMVEIRGTHTNIVKMEKDGFVVLDNDCLESNKNVETLFNEMTIQSIYDFACSLDCNDLKDCLLRQVKYNHNIALEGLKGQYGANIGRVILETEGDSVRNRAKAMAAAGSDARMSGSEMPVIINSGSGNQGITISLPVYEYAKHLNVNEDTFVRALALANLIAIHIKRGIGSLSAFCGAVSAGCGAGAGVAFLHDGDYNCIAHTVSNSLGILSGTICDGAKASCAAKIAYAVDAGILGYFMYTKGKEFYRGDGIISNNVEKTIKNIYRLGKLGMAQTDKEILSIMTDDVCD